MPEVPGSIPGADVQFPFFFLVEKKIDDREKIYTRASHPAHHGECYDADADTRGAADE